MNNMDLVAHVGTSSMADSLNWGTIGKRLLCSGLCLIPFIPGIIQQVADIPNRMMEKDYEFCWTKKADGGHEIRFGRNAYCSEMNSGVDSEQEDML